LTGGDVAFGLARKQFGQRGVEPVDGLDPTPGQCFAAVGEHPQRLKLPIDLQHPQGRGADRDDRDRVRIERVGLTVMARVEQPDPGGEFGRDVDHVLTGLQEPLGQGPAGSVSALDRPRSFGPVLYVGQHCRVAGPVGAEPTRTQQLLAFLDDLDCHRQLVGIDPDDDPFPVLLPPVLVPIWTARWALLLRAGQTLLEPRLVTAPDGVQTESEPHPHAGGQPRRERPAGYLDRVWPDTGPRAIV